MLLVTSPLRHRLLASPAAPFGGYSRCIIVTHSGCVSFHWQVRSHPLNLRYLTGKDSVTFLPAFLLLGISDPSLTLTSNQINPTSLNRTSTWFKSVFHAVPISSAYIHFKTHVSSSLRGICIYSAFRHQPQASFSGLINHSAFAQIYINVLTAYCIRRPTVQLGRRCTYKKHQAAASP